MAENSGVMDEMVESKETQFGVDRAGHDGVPPATQEDKRHAPHHLRKPVYGYASPSFANPMNIPSIVQIDNIPLGQKWKQIKYFIGGCIHYKNILEGMVLPYHQQPDPMHSKSCLVLFATPAVAQEAAYKLNGAVWNNNVLYVYPYSLVALPPPMGSFSAGSAGGMAFVPQMPIPEEPQGVFFNTPPEGQQFYTPQYVGATTESSDQSESSPSAYSSSTPSVSSAEVDTAAEVVSTSATQPESGTVSPKSKHTPPSPRKSLEKSPTEHKPHKVVQKQQPQQPPTAQPYQQGMFVYYPVSSGEPGGPGLPAAPGISGSPTAPSFGESGAHPLAPPVFQGSQGFPNMMPYQMMAPYPVPPLPAAPQTVGTAEQAPLHVSSTEPGFQSATSAPASPKKKFESGANVRRSSGEPVLNPLQYAPMVQPSFYQPVFQQPAQQSPQVAVAPQLPPETPSQGAAMPLNPPMGAVPGQVMYQYPSSPFLNPFQPNQQQQPYVQYVPFSQPGSKRGSLSTDSLASGGRRSGSIPFHHPFQGMAQQAQAQQREGAHAQEFSERAFRAQMDSRGMKYQLKLSNFPYDYKIRWKLLKDFIKDDCLGLLSEEPGLGAGEHDGRKHAQKYDLYVGIYKEKLGPEDAVFVYSAEDTARVMQDEGPEIRVCVGEESAKSFRHATETPGGESTEGEEQAPAGEERELAGEPGAARPHGVGKNENMVVFKAILGFHDRALMEKVVSQLSVLHFIVPGCHLASRVISDVEPEP